MGEVRLNTTVKRIRQATMYELRPSILSVPCSSDGTPSISNFTVSCYKVTGNNAPELCSCKMRYRRCTESSCTSFIDNNDVNTLTIPTAAYKSYNIQAWINNKLVQEIIIGCTLDGRIGGKGAKQRVTDWKTDTDYLQGKEGEEWYDIAIDENERYLCLISHHSGSKSPKQSVADSEGYWAHETTFIYIATRLMLAEKIKANQIDADDLIVKKLQTDTMNVVINNDTLKAVNAILEDVKGMTGSFKRLNCVNDNDDIIGGIAFGSDGKMWFSGDMYHQGYDYNKKRSLRFYTSDLWCRGVFGAAQRTTLKLCGSYGYYYTNGSDKNGVYVSFEKKTESNGSIYYNVPCYSGDGDVAGFPIDTIIFSPENLSNGAIFRYNLGLLATQRVIFINACDNFSNVYIWSNNNLVQWSGGYVAEVMRIPSDFLNPTISNNVIGRGIIFSGGRDNNWG